MPTSTDLTNIIYFTEESTKENTREGEARYKVSISPSDFCIYKFVSIKYFKEFLVFPLCILFVDVYLNQGGVLNLCDSNISLREKEIY